MATIIVKAGNFTAGETVNAYVRQKSGDYTTVPAVASGVAAADGSVTIAPVTGQRMYHLIGQTSAKTVDGFADNLLAPDGTDNVGVMLPYATSRLGASGAVVLTQNQLYVCRYSPAVDSIITKFAIEPSVVDAANPLVEIVILDMAGNRLATTGSVAGKLTVAQQQIVNLQAAYQFRAQQGVYVGIVTNSATIASLRCQVYAGSPGWHSLLGVNMPAQLAGTIAGVGTPVPANVGTTLGAAPNFPNIGLLL